MNKIEKILEEHLQFSSIRSSQIEGVVIEVMKEFGRLAFEAGRIEVWHTISEYSGFNKLKFTNYEDFLKEIEDENKSIWNLQQRLFFRRTSLLHDLY